MGFIQRQPIAKDIWCDTIHGDSKSKEIGPWESVQSLQKATAAYAEKPGEQDTDTDILNVLLRRGGKTKATAETTGEGETYI